MSNNSPKKPTTQRLSLIIATAFGLGAGLGASLSYWLTAVLAH